MGCCRRSISSQVLDLAPEHLLRRFTEAQVRLRTNKRFQQVGRGPGLAACPARWWRR